jgi:tyrosyl-tRNA synthetase
MTQDEWLVDTVACHTREDLAARVAEGRPLRVKFGVDPSSPDLHLGHAVPLRYLRRAQAFGHLPVLIIGDATAMVGDPSGRNITRPQLSREQVDRNAGTYLAQAGKVLDMGQVEIRYNSEWFGQMGFMDAIKLGAWMTVARMLERDTFAERMAAGAPVGLHELLYPLMQAHDSVQVRADIEVGGTDQTFNLLVGRDLMREAGQPPQVCITLPILRGLDGVQKMSKSLDNAIGLIESPREMYGKTMSVPDVLIPEYAHTATDLRHADLVGLSLRDQKALLARAIVTLYHGADEAAAAAEEFDRIFRDKGLPDEIPESTLPADLVEADGAWLVRVLTGVGLAPSSSAARRLIKEGGVRVDGERVGDEQARLPRGVERLIQVGKRRFHRVRVP